MRNNNNMSKSMTKKLTHASTLLRVTWLRLNHLISKLNKRIARFSAKSIKLLRAAIRNSEWSIG